MRAFLPFATLATAALFLGCQEQQWKIAFESERDGDLGIYVVNPDGSDLQRLTTGADKAWEPTWSPDRSKILVAARLHGGGQADEEVYVMDADGANMRRLTHTPGEGTSSWSVDWSPDGDRFLVARPVNEGGGATRRHFRVVVNFFEVLRQRMGN